MRKQSVKVTTGHFHVGHGMEHPFELGYEFVS